MSKIICFMVICFFGVSLANAQVDLQNSGTLYISTAADTLYINGNFTNTSSAGFTNNGRLCLTQNFSNNQASTTVGTGELYLNGTGAQFISTTGTSPFYKLSVNKSAGLTTLSSAVTVNAILDLTSGKIALNNYDLSIANTGTISNASAASYLVATGTGTLNQQVAASGSKTFPVGTSVDYMPATISLTAGSTTDLYNIRLLTAFYSMGTTGVPATSNVVNATWMITETVAGGSNASLTFQWPLSLELNGFNRSYSRVAHFISGVWEYGSADITASGSNPYSATRSGITSFSPFGVTMNQVVLPVNWLELTGKNNSNENVISWSTGTETNNAYFSVEASVKGISFAEVGRVAGAVNSNIVQAYNFVHTNINGQSFYYRIKQTDVDGKFVYSKVIRVDAAAFRTATLYPNPVKNKTTISFSIQQPSMMSVFISNASGLLVYRYNQRYNKGNNQMNLDLGLLPAGSYMLQLKDDTGGKQTFRFIKTN